MANNTVQNSIYYRKRVFENEKRRDALVRNYKKSHKKLEGNIRRYRSKLKSALHRESRIRTMVIKTNLFFGINLYKPITSRRERNCRDLFFKYALENRISGGAVSIFLKMDRLTASKRRRLMIRKLKDSHSLKIENEQYVLFMNKDL